jgi:hypothetical protein
MEKLLIFFPCPFCLQSKGSNELGRMKWQSHHHCDIKSAKVDLSHNSFSKVHKQPKVVNED